MLPVLSHSSMTSLGLRRPYLPSFDMELTEMTGNASLVSVQSFPAVGNRDNGSAA